MELELSELVYDRMSGVVSALEPYDHVGRCRKVIHYLSLALVSPLCAQNCSNTHKIISSKP